MGSTDEVVVNDLRVLITWERLGNLPWYGWIVGWWGVDTERWSCRLIVLSESTSAVLAERIFKRGWDAQVQLVRARFVVLADEGDVDSSDPARVQAMLDAVSAD